MTFRNDSTGAAITASYGSIPDRSSSSKDEEQTNDVSPLPTDRRSSFSSLVNGRSAASASLILFVLLSMVILRIERTEHEEAWRGFGSSTKTSAAASSLNNDNKAYSETFLLDEAYDETPLYYDDQQVDHLHEDDGRTYSQRYYKISRNFGGPGHPILVIMGGEASLDLPMLYPFVHDGLAGDFGAFVLSPEHRFYGESQPVGDTGGYPTVQQMMDYLSPDQALEDAIQLIEHVRAELGCDPDKTHPGYCPVLTFGGSYPGFLSAMLRFRYPDLVDGSYASSAPLDLYSQYVDGDAYFDRVTETADKAAAGCSGAVRSALYSVRDELYEEHNDGGGDVKAAAAAVGFCPATFPDYIGSIEEFVSESIQFLVPAIFADFNMGYYPPGPDTALSRACGIFLEDGVAPFEKIRRFFALRSEVEYGGGGDDDENAPSCFDVTQEIPAGANAKIRGSDNSGSGGGTEGRIWEFQCCKDLIVRAGYSTNSMFLPRPFSYEWHEEHCRERFPGIAVEPYRMNDQWGFADLTKTSRIVFANGMNDGWSVASITNATEVSDALGFRELVVLDFPNGAHHSELKAGPYPNPSDTPDILEGYQKATEILSGWLDDIAAYQEVL
eukprot:CAMPEP_0201126388 /NCGR_PEP_ID=MMETSP0850-20130426/25909_1 /ASSEMBLY_ACC=CAM_ASM_000622 /TAXON_ID=183588 /ORGANISM="Pseudo-nitzschia fraudulenta, Strain WWA7" /LENGTH=611 /DNA_ID=CAMNT_0047394807 /DNA_START=177 /DNA_END=2012 /DNA_ORIENTATION=-